MLPWNIADYVFFFLFSVLVLCPLLNSSSSSREPFGGMLGNRQPATKSLCNKIRLSLIMIQSNTGMKSCVSLTILRHPN